MESSPCFTAAITRHDDERKTDREHLIPTYTRVVPTNLPSPKVSPGKKTTTPIISLHPSRKVASSCLYMLVAALHPALFVSIKADRENTPETLIIQQVSPVHQGTVPTTVEKIKVPIPVSQPAIRGYSRAVYLRSPQSCCCKDEIFGENRLKEMQRTLPLDTLSDGPDSASFLNHLHGQVVHLRTPIAESSAQISCGVQ